MKSLIQLSTLTTLLASASARNTSASAGILSSGYLDLGDYQAAYDKAVAFVSQLTNDQKVSIITGSSFTSNSTPNNTLSWTGLISADGFAGLNQALWVSAFSSGQALAMTWDRQHMYDEAYASGSEFYGMGRNLIDGPLAGALGRTPYGGRGSESFGSDPYLAGIAMEKATKGMNDAGVVTVGRHFLLNEQETNRSASLGSTSGVAYSSNADDKTIHELYMWPFADAVHAGLGAVMCAMTRVNETTAGESKALLTGLLKEELGFPGLIDPDVGAQSSSFGSANAGLDLGSSQYWTTDILEAGIANGSFTQARLDDMAVRNVIGYYYVGLDNGEQPSEAALDEFRDVRANHSSLIRKIGSESLVLLKNSNSSNLGLPLNKPKVISVFGVHAGPGLVGPNFPFSVQGMDDPYQGHLGTGGGSGAASLSYLITPYEAINARARQDGSVLRYIMNDTYTSTSSSGMSMGGGGGGMPSMSGNSSSGGPSDSGNSTGGGMGGSDSTGGGNALAGLTGSGTSLTQDFSSYAGSSSACLVFINSASGEGGDRTVLYHTDQDTMINTVASNCNNTIVIINTPNARLVDNFISHTNVTAVLYGSLLGQESGNSITDVLYGDVNPSGKLTYTIAKNETDYPVSICYTATCNFTEGVYIDYRYFDAKNISVRYPFGHGLSYTTFSFGQISTSITNSTALKSTYPTGRLTLGGYADLFDEVISITTSVSNTGDVAGVEVAQLYVSYPAAADQPPRQLRGFEKVYLESGEEKEVTFSVRRRDVSYWDVVAQQWAIAKGTYPFSVGASSRDLRGSAEVTI